jgi:hypothetical protein
MVGHSRICGGAHLNVPFNRPVVGIRLLQIDLYAYTIAIGPHLIRIKSLLSLACN